MANPKTIIAAVMSAATIVAGAVSLTLSGTAQQEGTVYRAYRDIGGKWTICNGHTKGVRAGMMATKAQCDAWLRADLRAATATALEISPELAEKPSALAAAGDFILNAGDGWYRRRNKAGTPSPMRAAFARRDWRGGCEAFRGYIVLYRAPRVVPGGQCRRNAAGALYCQANGLINRREYERRLCLTGL